MSTHQAITVTPDAFLTLHYRLSSLAGVDIINTFNDKPATLSLGTGQLSPVLEQCLSEILRRHEPLRTRFEVVEGQPVQVIQPVAPPTSPRVSVFAPRLLKPP